ncbi:transposase family protein [Rathayibacter iranicus]|uniref:transposase family protein n=1 Tax=Rathayibacter iranicus TaxID=59737 RepID=UPI003B84A9B3
MLDNAEWRADPAHVGTSAVTSRGKPLHGQHDDNTRTANRYISPLRSAVERCIAHWKNWKILKRGYRGPLAEIPNRIRTITRLELDRLGW